MKRFSLFFASMLLGAFFLTSCLKGSSTEETATFCVFDHGKNGTLVFKSPIGHFYAPEINNLYTSGAISPGECYSIEIKIDYKLPENATNVINANGYMTVTLLKDPESVPQFELNPFLTDITTILPGEIPLQRINPHGGMTNYLFMEQDLHHASDVELEWIVSYDPSMMPKEEYGKRYYDIYIRATVARDSQQPKSTIKRLTAYYMGSYLRDAAIQEQYYLTSINNYTPSSTFTIRYHYVTGLDMAENRVFWANGTLEAPIYIFLEDY